MGAFTTTYLGSLRCENLHEQSGTTILTDAPTDNHGMGSAFSPTDLCALSLSTCIITTMGLYAQSRNLNLLAVEARTLKHMSSDPRRIGRIEVHLKVTVPESTNDRDREGLTRVAHTCPVARSLHPEIVQDVQISWSHR